jgi:predicted amidohydrolase
MIKNVDRICKAIDFVFASSFSSGRGAFPTQLICFPEYAISGYCEHAEGVGGAIEKAGDTIPGEYTDRIAEKAKQYKCYIQPGSMYEIHPEFPNACFNSAPLISPEGKVLIVYRKVNPFLPCEFNASPHDLLDVGFREPLFPVAKTEIGNIGIYNCYDGMHPEPARQLAFNGAEVLINPALIDSPNVVAPWDIWDVRCRFHSFTNIAYGINTNGTVLGQYLSPCQGQSNICDYEGRVLSRASTGTGDDTIFAYLDIRALREYRRNALTCNQLPLYRGDAYDYHKNSLPKNRAIKDDLTWNEAKSIARIRDIVKVFYERYYEDAVK